jgi:hypothetical protein
MKARESGSSCLVLVLGLAIAGCDGGSASKSERRNLGDIHGVCVDAPEQAVHDVHPKGIDTENGRISLGDARVEYSVGWGMQGDFKYGRRIELPHLSHGPAKVSFWEDPELTAFVVEGLRTGGARAHVWYMFEGTSAKSRSLAEQLARQTDYCDPAVDHR